MNCHVTRAGQDEIEQFKANALVPTIARYTELKAKGGEYVGCCPFHAEKTPSFTVVPKKRFFHCFGCGVTGDVFSFLQQKEGLSFTEALERLRGGASALPAASAPPSPRDAKREEEERREKIAAARKIWGESIPAIGTLVEKYLASRGLSGVMIPPSIRFHPKLWNAETKTNMPAMIGCVAMRNQIVGVHRTYLRSDGSGKAAVRAAKMMLGACGGGHVWLDSPGSTLAVAEGIETALSIKKACPWLNIWAALSLSNMKAEVPGSVKELILCADADEKDRAAADRAIEQAAFLHTRTGRLVRIARPAPGKDFNDMIRGAK